MIVFEASEVETIIFDPATNFDTGKGAGPHVYIDSQRYNGGGGNMHVFGGDFRRGELHAARSLLSMLRS